jgi:hypothetical protein
VEIEPGGPIGYRAFLLSTASGSPLYQNRHFGFCGTGGGWQSLLRNSFTLPRAGAVRIAGVRLKDVALLIFGLMPRLNDVGVLVLPARHLGPFHGCIFLADTEMDEDGRLDDLAVTEVCGPTNGQNRAIQRLITAVLMATTARREHNFGPPPSVSPKPCGSVETSCLPLRNYSAVKIA